MSKLVSLKRLNPDGDKISTFAPGFLVPLGGQAGRVRWDLDAEIRALQRGLSLFMDVV